MPVTRQISKYTLMEELGRGGSGVVYRALDTNLGRIVALKVLIAGRFAGKEERKRFHREAELAAKIDHPLVVKQYDADVKENVPYIASELIEGTKLEGSAERFGWTFKQVAHVIAEIADAISAAHQKGIIHRDLKPANIIVDGDDRPHITDFGLAKAIGTSNLTSDSGQILGTPAYMSSEQADEERKQVDFRTDIYSIGAILYELLTGVPPFQGTRDQIIFQVLHDEPPAPITRNPRIPKDLETICVRAMSKDPSRRFQSAEDFRDELLRFTRGEPILSRPISRMERAFRFCKRYPTQTASVTGIILLLATSTLAVTLWGIDARNRAERESRLRQRQQELLRERTEELVRLNLERANESTALGQLGKSLAWINNAQRIDDQNLIPRQHYDRRWSLTSAAHLTLTTCIPIDSFRRLVSFDDANEQVIVSTSDAIEIYSTTNGQLYRRIKTNGYAQFVATNLNKTELAIVQTHPKTKQYDLEIWDLATSRRLIDFTLPDAPSAVAFAPQTNDILIKSAKNNCYLFSRQDGSIQRIFADKSVFLLKSTRRNCVVATIDHLNTVSIFRDDLTYPLASHKFTKSIRSIPMIQTDGFIMAESGDGDGKRFFCWNYEQLDSEPLGWDDKEIRSAEIDPARQRILISGPRSINVYSLHRKKPLFHLDRVNAEIRSASWSSDNSVYFMTGPTSSHFSLSNWQIDRDHISENCLTLAAGVRGIAMSSDHYFLLTYGRDSILRIWSPPSQDCAPAPFAVRPAAELQIAVPEPAPFSSNQPELALLHAMQSNLDMSSIANDIDRSMFRGTLLQDSQKRFLAGTTKDKRFQVIEQADSKVLFDIPVDSITGRKIFKDENDSMFALIRSANEIVIAPVNPLKPIIRLSTAIPTFFSQVVFHPTQPLIAAYSGLDGSIVIWRINDEEHPIARFRHRSPVSIVQWTASEDRLIIIGQDGKVAVYQIQDNSATVGSQFNVDKVITASAVDATGSMLAITTNQNDVHLWDLDRGEPCSPQWHFQFPISAVRFTSDGKSLYVGDTFGLVHCHPIEGTTLPVERREDYLALTLGEKLGTDGRWKDVSTEELKKIAAKWRQSSPPNRSLSLASQVNWHKRQAVEAILSDAPDLSLYHYKEATRLNQRDITLHIDLAHACALDEDWNDSLKNWEKAIELGDRHFTTYCNAFLVAAKDENNESLTRAMRRLEKEFLHSNDSDVLVKMAQMYVSVPPPIGNLDESIRLARRAMELRSDDSRAPMVLGGALYLRGDKEEARQVLNKAVKNTPFEIVGIVSSDDNFVPQIVRRQVEYFRESATQKSANVERAYTKWTSSVEADLIESRSPEFKNQ